MESVYVWLIAGLVILLLGGAAYLYFRFVRGSATVNSFFSVGSSVVKGVANMLPDKVDALDAHDVVLVIGRLFEAIPQWAADPTNVTFDDCKDEVLAFVETQRSVVPQLDKLPKETLEKVASALFGLAKAVASLGDESAPAPIPAPVPSGTTTASGTTE